MLPEPIEKFLRGDSFFSICLIKSIEKLGLFGWRKRDTAQALDQFIRRDRLSPLGLGDRFQELRLELRRNLECFIRFARKDGDDGALGQGIPLDDYLSAYDGSGSELHRCHDTPAHRRTGDNPGIEEVQRMARSKSSKAWLRRHVNDPYVHRAKAQGYRSRSAYKLIEIAKRDKLAHPGDTVVDLGAAPGGWAQALAERVGRAGRVIAVDLLEIAPIPGVTGFGYGPQLERGERDRPGPQHPLV